MYDVIRKNDPNGIIIVSGMQQYAFDAPTQIAFFLRYKEENGAFPTNVMLNYHPYQAIGQGPEKSLLPTLRMVLAGKQMAPVIFTEVWFQSVSRNLKGKWSGVDCLILCSLDKRAAERM